MKGVHSSYIKKKWNLFTENVKLQMISEGLQARENNKNMKAKVFCGVQPHVGSTKRWTLWPYWGNTYIVEAWGLLERVYLDGVLHVHSNEVETNKYVCCTVKRHRYNVYHSCFHDYLIMQGGVLYGCIFKVISFMFGNYTN